MKVTREFHIESAGNPHNSVYYDVKIPLIDGKTNKKRKSGKRASYN